MPDQGTTPISRRMDKRIQGDVGLASESVSAFDAPPSSAERVRSKAFGKKWVRKGASGLERSVAQVDPMVVRRVRRRVAYAGENKAPARTFCWPQSKYRVTLRNIWNGPRLHYLGLTKRASRPQ